MSGLIASISSRKPPSSSATVIHESGTPARVGRLTRYIVNRSQQMFTSYAIWKPLAIKLSPQ